MVNIRNSKFGAKLFGLLSPDEIKRRSDILRRLVNAESRIGSEVLGFPLHGGRREFFMSPTHSNEWLWHEETPDGSKSLTVRYIVSKEEGAFKSSNGAVYELVVGKELDNLMSAIKSYHYRVMKDIYPNHTKQVAQLI